MSTNDGLATALFHARYDRMAQSQSESDTGGTASVSADLLAACYDDTRRIARRIIASDGAKRRLQATELANEAAIRLMGLDRMEIKARAHMLAMAARTMRRILIDAARKGGAAKRHAPTFVARWPDDAPGDLINVVDLDRALEALDAVSPKHAQVIEMRFMLGLSVAAAAAPSGIPERTIKRRWQSARALALFEHLADRPGNGKLRARLTANESEAVLNPAARTGSQRNTRGWRDPYAYSGQRRLR